jgi:hypothetical protein
VLWEDGGRWRGLIARGHTYNESKEMKVFLTEGPLLFLRRCHTGTEVKP